MEGAAPRGSQHWLQIAVNQCPEVIDNAIVNALGIPQGESIRWLSPLKRDDPPFKEYRDEEFLQQLNIKLERKPLADFGREEARNGTDWPAPLAIDASW